MPARPSNLVMCESQGLPPATQIQTHCLRIRVQPRVHHVNHRRNRVTHVAELVYGTGGMKPRERAIKQPKTSKTLTLTRDEREDTLERIRLLSLSLCMHSHSPRSVCNKEKQEAIFGAEKKKQVCGWSSAAHFRGRLVRV